MASVGQLWPASRRAEQSHRVHLFQRRDAGGFRHPPAHLLDVFEAAPLSEPARAAVQQRSEALKVDYALRYLDSMIQGIREGAERSRKIRAGSPGVRPRAGRGVAIGRSARW